VVLIPAWFAEAHADSVDRMNRVLDNLEQEMKKLHKETEELYGSLMRSDGTFQTKITQEELVIPIIDRFVIGGEELQLVRIETELYYYYTYKIGDWQSEFKYGSPKTAEENMRNFYRVYSSLYNEMT
jgi:hypothetical protein